MVVAGAASCVGGLWLGSQSWSPRVMVTVTVMGCTGNLNRGSEKERCGEVRRGEEHCGARKRVGREIVECRERWRGEESVMGGGK